MLYNFSFLCYYSFTVYYKIAHFVYSHFIQKGADVNAVGGELHGTPLHWATRYIFSFIFIFIVYVVHSTDINVYI